MKRVYFNSGEIIEGRQCVVKRAIKQRVKADPFLRYKFSGDFSVLDQCVYDYRTGNIRYTQKYYPYDILMQAYDIVMGVAK